MNRCIIFFTVVGAAFLILMFVFAMTMLLQMSWIEMHGGLSMDVSAALDAYIPKSLFCLGIGLSCMAVAFSLFCVQQALEHQKNS